MMGGACLRSRLLAGGTTPSPLNPTNPQQDSGREENELTTTDLLAPTPFNEQQAGRRPSLLQALRQAGSSLHPARPLPLSSAKDASR